MTFRLWAPAVCDLEANNIQKNKIKQRRKKKTAREQNEHITFCTTYSIPRKTGECLKCSLSPVRIKASTTGRQAAERERGGAGRERRIRRGGDSRENNRRKNPPIKRERELLPRRSWRKQAAVSITAQLSRLVPSAPTENEAAPASVCEPVRVTHTQTDTQHQHWCYTLCTMQMMWGAASFIRLFFSFFFKNSYSESPGSPSGVVLLRVSQSLNTPAQLHSRTCTGPAGDKGETHVRGMDDV